MWVWPVILRRPCFPLCPLSLSVSSLEDFPEPCEQIFDGDGYLGLSVPRSFTLCTLLGCSHVLHEEASLMMDEQDPVLSVSQKDISSHFIYQHYVMKLCLSVYLVLRIFIT